MASRIQALQSEDGSLKDSLDGIALLDGERLMVRWPSGALQEVRVKLRIVYHGQQRDGAVVNVPCQKAFMGISAFGGTVGMVPLVGFLAQRLS